MICGKLMMSAALMAALIAAPHVAAQTSANTQTQQQLPVFRQQVEVVATRLPESPHDVPASVEVFTDSDIRSLGATTLRDVLSVAAGVEVASGGDEGPASAVPEFWGLREFDAFLLVVDGVPWGGVFNPAVSTLSLADVARVEVLRGAAPVTYGTTSFVGVIHVVHETADVTGGYFSVRQGSFGSTRLAIDLPVTLSSTWKSRLSVDFTRQGFRDDRTSYKGGHALWRVEKTETGRRTWLNLDLALLRQHPASPHPREGAVLSAAVPLDANHNPEHAFLDQDRIAVAFGNERSLSNGARWTNSVSFARSAHDIFRGFLTDIRETSSNATGFREKIGINDLYADTHLTLPVHPGVYLTTGADFLHGNGDANGAVFTYSASLNGLTATRVPEPSSLDLDSEDQRQFLGGYALAEWNPTERLHFSSGLRMNLTSERKGEGQRRTHARPSGSVGLMFTAWKRDTDHVRVFADYRNTFKPAAVDFSLTENEGTLEPETAHSYEGGVKVRTAHSRLDIDVSAFHMDFRNLVTSTVVNGLPALINAGQTRFRGLDTAADVRLPHDVTGRFTYSFHDGKFVDFVQAFGNVPTQLAGKRFEMSPRRLASVGIVLGPPRGVIGSLIVKYTGDRYLNKRNTALASPFTTIDMGLGYRFGGWELRLDGRNLTNRRDPISESEIGDAQYYRMTARQFDVGLGMRF